MVKSVVITLTGSIPDTALSVDATVTVNNVVYTGKVTGIITHEEGGQVPDTTTVTLKGTGLSVG